MEGRAFHKLDNINNLIILYYVLFDKLFGFKLFSERRNTVNHLVESFSVGLAEGISGAMEVLDRQVAGLGDIIIHSITDTHYTAEQNGSYGTAPGPRLVRVVVYSMEREIPEPEPPAEPHKPEVYDNLAAGYEPGNL